jgi:uncharacterized protein YqjF (DUF2071 family)
MGMPTPAGRLAVRDAPAGPPVLYQKWRRLLFLHWGFPPDAIQKTLPPGLTVDAWEGKAWCGIVPFQMRDIRPRFCPAVPGISNFLEMNVRTYVYDRGGRPGVWFYSLDANRRLAVRIGRSCFYLPYTYSRMEDGADYRVRRDDGRACAFRYGPRGPVGQAAPGTFEFFLVERYLLFAWNARREELVSGQVHHTPYPIQQAAVEQWDDGPFEWNGLARPGQPPEHALYTEGVDVRVYGTRPVDWR